jgi:heat shock protein HslJ
MVSALLGAAVLTLSGCGSGAEHDLDGMRFKSESGSDANGELAWITEQQVRWRMTMMNNGYAAVISAPCNTLTAPVRVTSDKITIDAGRAVMTEIGCFEPVVSMDAWVLSFIGEPIDYTWDGDTLAMANESGNLNFVRASD